MLLELGFIFRQTIDTRIIYAHYMARDDYAISLVYTVTKHGHDLAICKLPVLVKMFLK